MAVASGGSTSCLSSASSWTFVDANSGWTFAGTGASLYRTTDGGNRWVLADLTTASGCWLFSEI
jgi:photosystem II stability/assembly factor-like uncharacterized protein